ncbi:MAG: NAD(P)-binding protein [Emcibacteraceae bacterium]|nr:NAD(P)-binding protein [Emcibacteraceae bacterium]
MTKRKNITRRDFLDGVAITATASAVGATLPAYAQTGAMASSTSAPYPPQVTGMRGNHPGSYDHAHPLAWDGEALQGAIDTGEEYDLIVVGGGLSGLSAACMWQREKGTDQRILILDNHDDFGGHAKRNEFMVDGHMLLGIGGSVNLENPSEYSDDCVQLLEEVGLDFDKLIKANEGDPLATLGSTSGIFLKDENGKGTITVGKWRRALHGYDNYQELINKLPIPQSERDKIIKLAGGDWDYLVGLSIMERMEYLDTTTYHQFLLEKVGLAPEHYPLFESLIRVLAGVGGDSLSVQEAILYGAPGLGSVGWPWEIMESLFFGSEDAFETYMMPDGNASLARLMVRHMIPSIAPGHSMDNIATAKFDYSKLDEERSSVRIRLNSTAINAKQDGDQVIVRYVKDGKPYSAKAKHSILACYNGIIPHLCPELPEEQKEGLKYQVKMPLVWASVALKDGSVFERAGSSFFECPYGYFTVVTQSPATKLDDYQAPQGPNDPLTVFMMSTPIKNRAEDQTVHDVFRETRYKMLATSFEEIETEIRNQLTDLFGPYGFDAERDIEGIIVNRWAHGYAYEYYGLFDNFEEGSYPHEIGRKQFGRISIANSDAGAKAYLNVAIDEAWRAVQEQM